MSLFKLNPDSKHTTPFQDTTLSHDALGRYICNTWDEVEEAQTFGGYPFDVVVIGGGMFGGYLAEKLYRQGTPLGLRILVLEAGAYLFPSHIQNLPHRVGGKIGGVDSLRTRDTGTQNVIWGMPWISNVGFPGLAYCLGGRSLFWGGWSPRMTDDDLAAWPSDVRSYLQSAAGYDATEKEIGVVPSTDYIVQAALYQALFARFTAVMAQVPGVTQVKEAPLAVQGSSPASGVFAFDKFSSAPFLIDALRDDASTNFSQGDVTRRLFFVPRAHVHRLDMSGDKVTSIDFSNNGVRKILALSPRCAVVLANGTIEATRLALESFGVGSMQFGSPRLGNLMAHLRSNITVRIKRTALGLTATPSELETVALIVRGTAFNRRYHIQVTAASIAGANPEANMWSMVPDIDQLANMTASQNPDWVTITLRCIGEMEDDKQLPPNANKSWIDLSDETDGLMRRAYVNLVPTQNDRSLWTAMDNAAFELAARLAQSPQNIQYWNGTDTWLASRPAAGADGSGFWRDTLGTTHHEAGTLFMGQPGSSLTDSNGRFHKVANAYVSGPALFPTLGSANPSLTALSLARRTAAAIIGRTSPAVPPEFEALSLDPKDWQIVRRLDGSDSGVKHYGKVLETAGAYALYWYTKEQFDNFVLHAEWRVAHRQDNSGIYIRTAGPAVFDPLQAADEQGLEVQIDERGYDSATGSEGTPRKHTGAIYDLQAPSVLASRPVGEWNNFRIEADGTSIRVTLNGQLVTTYTSSRRPRGYLAVQVHDDASRVQFRNLAVRKL